MVLETIQKFGCLTREQVELMHFAKIKNSTIVCQRRLKALYDKRKLTGLDRERYSISEPYIYWVGKRPKQVEHVLGVNWALLWLLTKRTKWEKIAKIEREDKYSMLRSDGFFIKKNNVTGACVMYYIEFDNARSGNDFNKVKLYNELYDSNEWTKKWWARYATGFPSVLVVTNGRTERISERIERENRNGLEFIVKSLDEVKGEMLNDIHGSGSGRRSVNQK
jgi:hypothetical protein